MTHKWQRKPYTSRWGYLPKTTDIKVYGHVEGFMHFGRSAYHYVIGTFGKQILEHDECDFLEEAKKKVEKKVSELLGQ